MDRRADRGEPRLMQSETHQPSLRVALVSLSDVIARAPDDQEPAPGFAADLHSERVEVTAILQRTAVVEPLGDRWADKQVVRHADLLVDPASIVWRPRAAMGFSMKRRRDVVGQREEVRAASDRRAHADQARQAAAETAARESTAQQCAASTTRPSAGATAARPLTAAASSRPIAVSALGSAAP